MALRHERVWKAATSALFVAAVFVLPTEIRAQAGTETFARQAPAALQPTFRVLFKEGAQIVDRNATAGLKPRKVPGFEHGGDMAERLESESPVTPMISAKAGRPKYKAAKLRTCALASPVPAERTQKVPGEQGNQRSGVSAEGGAVPALADGILPARRTFLAKGGELRTGHSPNAFRSSRAG